MKTRINQIVSSFSFRDKVLLLTITCLILPAICTFSIYNYLTKDAVEEQAIISAKNELKLTDEYLKKIFEDMLYTLNFIQLDTELNTIFRNPKLNTDDLEHDSLYINFINDKKVNRILETLTLRDQSIFITIILNNGKFYSNYSFNEYSPELVRNESWFKKLSQLTGYRSIWLEPHTTMFASEKLKSPDSISVARVLQDSITGVYGYAIITTTVDRISEILKSENSDNHILLMNDTNLLIGTNQDLDKMLSTHVRSKEYFKNETIIRIEGQDYLINTRDLSITDWKLISLIPYEKATFRVNAIFNKIFIVQTIAFLLFLFLLTFILSKILNRLVDLRNFATNVQSGDLSVRSSLTGNDEIATLSTSFNLMLDKVREMIEENTIIQSRKRQAELEMLQAQINPHFLFNVLNSIRMKVLMKRDHESAKMISSLSKLLRMTIDKNKGMITFQEELEINRDYIRLMNMRQKHEIGLEINVCKETHHIKLPRLVLQPIIENAIIHGLNGQGGVIEIEALFHNHTLKIVIEDSGGGIEDEHLLKLNENLKHEDLGSTEDSEINGFSSIGLSNVYERMKLTFGENFIMHVQSELNKGTKVTMVIPIQEE
ncbi:sensor histidine kinase [Peribacillus huizhouensis]|uniref:Two-component system sensor histidine kinase YesM n=1 Tax=Peribacillus huizhouensis TaxID=1501239 RepID=A0ABR6CUF7_9BACI|nr:sensor histidine kinase [Peribacillus huizhouensis]MBA9028288.1 two-component system sensor histidine kinase YesM [Peribacillus huizhouensis]